MSFPTEEDVFDTVEAFLVEAFAAAGIAARAAVPAADVPRGDGDATGPTGRTCASTCRSATSRRPAAGTGFAPFEKALAGRGGTVRGLRVPGGAAFSRKQLDELTEKAREHGAAGLLWVKKSGGEVTSPAKKSLPRGDSSTGCSPRPASGTATCSSSSPTGRRPAFAALAALRAEARAGAQARRRVADTSSAG